MPLPLGEDWRATAKPPARSREAESQTSRQRSPTAKGYVPLPRSPSPERGGRSASPERPAKQDGDICGCRCESNIYGRCTRSCIRPPRHKGGPHVCFPCEEAHNRWIQTGKRPGQLPKDDTHICAVSKRKIDAFTIVGAWLLDTGCPDDMVSRDLAITLAHFFRTCAPKQWHSANGNVTCDSVLPIAVPDIADNNTEVYVMEDTPPLLSIGKRVIHRGYSFMWLNGKAPCLITPRNRIIPLDMSGDCPFIKKGGIHETYCTSDQIALVTGFRFTQNGLCVDNGATIPRPAPEKARRRLPNKARCHQARLVWRQRHSCQQRRRRANHCIFCFLRLESTHMQHCRLPSSSTA